MKRPPIFSPQSLPLSNNTMVARAPEEESIVMFPFMAQGHIIPFLALAFQIQQRTPYQIIFVNTPLNVNKLRPSLPPNTCINLVELPFCSTDHGLPPDSENTDSIPFPHICRFLEASVTLKPSFDQLIEDITRQQQGHPPLCIIADMFFGWTVDVANRFDIFHSIFLTGSAYGSAFLFILWHYLPHCDTDEDEFSLPDFPEVSKLSRSQLPLHLRNANGTDPWSLILQKLISYWLKSDGILIQTLEEFDQIGLNYFRRKTGNRPVWPIVPSLYSSPNKFRPQKKSGIDLEHCIDWLDNHPPESVLFVSFGSQNTISSSQLMNLAIGLEASGKNFIWVLRPPLGFDINEEFRSEWLPEGYRECRKEGNRGLIVHKWAPQLEILSHKSTCAFLSHCGWNSTLESLSYGVPMIAWPLSADQFYNSKMLEEELGVSIEVARGNACEVSHEKIKGVIELVMGGTEKGKEMKKKALDVKVTIEDAIRETEDYKGSSVKVIEDFFTTAFARKVKLDSKTNEV